MPIARFQMPDGRIGRFEVPEGTTPEQAQQAIAAHISQQSAPKSAATASAKPFGQQLNDAVSDAPRQIGLTARHALEGAGGAFDALVGNPLRTLAAPIFGNKPTAETGRTIADLAGLPSPVNARERVVGDAARMLAGGAVPIAAAGRLAQGAVGATKAVASQLAANPLQQLASAGAAGAAGGYTRETGGNDGSQLLASLAAGVATPLAINGVQRVAGGVRQMVNRPVLTDAQLDVQISRALGPGVSVATIAPDVRAAIRKDVAAALKISDDLDPDALRRLVDYRTTGLTPTVGKLTRDPATFTQEENLMRVGANSKDKAAQTLGAIKNTNSNRLIELINGSGAATPDDAIGGANKIMGALASRDARAKQIIGSLYDRARDSGGRSAPLDPSAFTQRAGNLLHESNVESFLTPDIRNKLNGFATGEIPLTVEIAEQFKTGIGRLQRNSTDGNVRHALGLVRQALDDTPLLNRSAPAGGNMLTGPGRAPNLGQEAIDAFNKARRVNRTWMGIVERTPALEAVRDGIEPDKFVQQFIVGAGPKAQVANVEALHQSIKGSPEAMSAVKGQIAAALKKAALNGASDEVGVFSQSGYNKTLQAIGERKLGLFFAPDEVAQLKAIGRVASYEQAAPAGAFPNRSNTAGAMAGLLERFIDNSLLSKIPLGRAVLQEPAENILIGIKAKNALTAPKALASGARTRNPLLLEEGRGLMFSPALFMGERDDERR